MRANRASSTAKMVALWRTLADDGVTTVPEFHDPYAARLLDGRFTLALRLFRWRLSRANETARGKTIRGIDAIPIRVATIDAALADAVRAGCRQVVILGAGLDTRAWRLDSLAGLPLYEVDHPATQAEKRERALELPPPLARLSWTSVDFERESLSQRLAEAGHALTSPTAWVWEGVVMYLGDEAVRGTLGAIRARSAAGSVLILHYHEPSSGLLARGIRGVLMRALGEPQIGTRTRGAMRDLVERAGFVITADLGTAEQAAKVGARTPAGDLARVSRILIARVE